MLSSLWMYYWVFAKHFGRTVWRDRGREFLSSLVLAIITCAVVYVFKREDTLTSLEIGVVSLVGWLAVFAFGHFVKAPYALHVKESAESAKSDHWVMGVIGISVVVLIGSAITGLAVFAWKAHTNLSVNMSAGSADPGAKNAEITLLQAKVIQVAKDLEKAKQAQGKKLKPKSGGNTTTTQQPQQGTQALLPPASPPSPTNDPSPEATRNVQQAFILLHCCPVKTRTESVG